MFTGHNFDGAPCLTGDNPALFLSVIEHTGSAKVERCRRVCGECSHSDICLTLGYYNGEALPGVFGGLSEAERDALIPSE